MEQHMKSISDYRAIKISKPRIKKKEYTIHQRQQRTPPDAGPLATSGCCWVTSDEQNEQQLPNHVLISKLWNHYNSKCLRITTCNNPYPVMDNPPSFFIIFLSFFHHSNSQSHPEVSPSLIFVFIQIEKDQRAVITQIITT